MSALGLSMQIIGAAAIVIPAGVVIHMQPADPTESPQDYAERVLVREMVMEICLRVVLVGFVLVLAGTLLNR